MLCCDDSGERYPLAWTVVVQKGTQLRVYLSVPPGSVLELEEGGEPLLPLPLTPLQLVGHPAACLPVCTTWPWTGAGGGWRTSVPSPPHTSPAGGSTPLAGLWRPQLKTRINFGTFYQNPVIFLICTL